MPIVQTRQRGFKNKRSDFLSHLYVYNVCSKYLLLTVWTVVYNQCNNKAKSFTTVKYSILVNELTLIVNSNVLNKDLSKSVSVGVTTILPFTLWWQVINIQFYSFWSTSMDQYVVKGKYIS